MTAVGAPLRTGSTTSLRTSSTASSHPLRLRERAHAMVLRRLGARRRRPRASNAAALSRRSFTSSRWWESWTVLHAALWGDYGMVASRDGCDLPMRTVRSKLPRPPERAEYALVLRGSCDFDPLADYRGRGRALNQSGGLASWAFQISGLAERFIELRPSDLHPKVLLEMDRKRRSGALGPFSCPWMLLGVEWKGLLGVLIPRASEGSQWDAGRRDDQEMRALSSLAGGVRASVELRAETGREPNRHSAAGARLVAGHGCE